MLYGLIVLGFALIITIAFVIIKNYDSLYDDDQIGIAHIIVIILSWAVGGAFVFASFIISVDTNFKYRYVTYEDGKLNVSEEPTKYMLGVSKRTSAWNLSDEVIEYNLKDINGTKVDCTKDINDVFDYFEMPAQEVYTRNEHND